MKNDHCIRIFADAGQIKSCKEKIRHAEKPLKLLSNALNLAGNEVRLKILFLVSQEKKVCVCDLSDILGMNISAISQHLRKLKDGGLIRPEKTGQTVFYSLSPECIKLFRPYFNMLSKNKVQETV